MSDTDTTRTLMIEPIGGISGDMFLAACIDAGILTIEQLRAALGGLVPIERVMLARETRASIAGARLVSHLDEHHHHAEHDHGRTLAAIERAIASCALPDGAKRRAVAIFETIASAEARVHGVSREGVHLHEVGADDSLFDVCGAALALELCDAKRIFCGTIPLGSGFVEFSHGRWPVPAPAVLELLRGLPVVEGALPFEMTTPTGAAIVRHAVTDWGPPAAMCVEAIGYGLGTRDHPRYPNCLRLRCGTLIASAGDVDETDEVEQLTFLVDDLPACDLAPTIEVLLQIGALDAYATTCVGKKGRFAFEFCVLTRPDDAEAIASWILRESATIGLRRQRLRRRKLGRDERSVSSGDGADGVWRAKRISGPESGEARIAIEADSVSEYCRQYRVGPRRAREELARRFDTAQASEPGHEPGDRKPENEER
ncbi:MAG: LarC family nickel insertion protein [Myxococcales bacterium]|nr:LarC family nickel insertion protein [Myxococcales bacterium]